MKTKTKKNKGIPPISEWSVNRYGVNILVNFEPRYTHLTDGISLDVEDDEKGNFVGLGISDGTTCMYWSDWELVKQLTIPKFIAHNGSTDLEKLQKWGFKVDQSFLMWDTQLMEHILDSSKKRYGLKALAANLGIVYPSYEDLCGKKDSKYHTTLDKLPVDLVSEYNACDCYATYKLYERQVANNPVATTGHGKESMRTPATSASQYFEDIEKPVSFIFRKMETRGISVDLEYLKDLKETLEAQKAPIETSIKNELGDINLNSPKQLLGALHAKSVKPELKGRPSTDKRALESVRSVPVVQQLLQYSEVATLLSSFVEPYLERGQDVVHPSFYQCGTRTGRPSCRNPNLLQIPRRTENGKLVRRMFTARPGYLLGDCDFGQIEPRVLAHFSKDKNLCKLFNDGIKFHEYTQQRMGFGGTIGKGPEYDRAKVLNLSVGYRATYRSVSAQLKCSFHQAEEEIRKWWDLFPELYDWEQKLIYDSKRSGYCTTLMGRRIRVEDLDNGNAWRREGAERQLINNITQGSAAEIMKMAMIGVDSANIDILVQVYDELLIESPKEGAQEELLKTVDIMEHCVDLDVPLTVDAGMGKNWAEAKP